MDSAELRTQLVKWLNEIKWWSGASTQDWNDYILTDEKWFEYRKPLFIPGYIRVPKDDRLHVVLFTETHEYSISAYGPTDECNGALIGYAACRKRVAGENWFRGNYLSDGPFNKDTWDIIMLGIIRFELIAKPVKPKVTKADVG